MKGSIFGRFLQKKEQDTLPQALGGHKRPHEVQPQAHMACPLGVK